MGFVLMLLAVITGVAIFIFLKDEPDKRVVIDEGVAEEVCELFVTMKEFAKSRYWDGETGIIMMIPVNKKGDMYSPDSCRIRLSILLYRDDIRSILLFSKEERITERFDLIESPEYCFSYVATTYTEFSTSYKPTMAALCSKLRTQFPDVKFNFDGSRITVDNL